MVVGDEEVKLLLEAFQMSVSACLAQPGAAVLRAQMAGRLLSVPQSRSLQARTQLLTDALMPCVGLLTGWQGECVRVAL